MEKLVLKIPTRQFSDQIMSFRQELLQSGSSMDGCGSLRRTENPEDWFREIESLSKKETLPANRVVSTQFLYVRERDDRIVGMIQIRHELNDYLKNYAGHIGYCVRPSERQKGYAKQMLHDCLSYCRKLGLTKVLVACIDSNEASRRTILANGGVYESTVLEPEIAVNLERYWIDLTRGCCL